MFGALAVGETRITGLLEGEDVLRTAAAMRALGAEVVRDAGRRLARRRPRRRRPGRAGGRAGHGQFRHRRAAAVRHPRQPSDLFAVMTGDASLRRRPMRRVIDPLTACGARFAARDGGRLPLAIEGARDALPLDYRVPVPSAQVKSARAAVPA